MMLEPSRRYPEDIARRVLARAIELDAAERASITERELRGIGLTLGIAGALALQPRVAGLTNGALPAIIFGIVEVASGALVVYADDDDHFQFQRTNTALWTAVAMGIIGTFTVLIDRGVFAAPIATLLTWAFTGWVISSLLGGGAIALRSRRASRAHEIDGSTGGGLSGLLKVARSIAERIKAG